ncbi:LysR family transcriptional regulator [Acinetobacter guillouiae]|uniref:LysR family transcriptional regulator n=1 Tax=Acinetobacter guillouiae TaxID=106649 RepID=UPI001AE30FC7|nr:LysR family transcriptional regulator [Acinetobacter guillouiae]MBP2544052.1 DNA-binding transcriptional LysR family regulator [Acinetobacter guillouiae]
MLKKRISLNSFKFFYYVAMYESATIASEKLSVTQGAVSRQIKNLEDTLKTTLFIRKGKNLELTSEGVLLLNCCQNIFHEIDKCLIKLNNRETDLNELVISCESTLCMKWLIPRLKSFNDLNNPFKIKIITDDKLTDFNHLDLAIRRDDFHWKEHIYNTKLVNEIMFFIQNPAHIGENILISSSRPKFWGSLLKINQIRDKITHFHYKELDHFSLCIEGCLSGLGVTFASGYMIENELKNQKLEPIITPFQDGSSYYLLSASPFEEDYRKTVFKNWLIEELRQTEKFLEKYTQVKVEVE